MSETAKKLKVLFQNRSNAFDMPGGDTIVMKRLKEQLEKNGATVDFIPQITIDNIDTYDIIHLFNLTVPQCTEPFAKNAVRHNIPFVVTSLQENFPQYLHKANAAAGWFREYIDATESGRSISATLSEALSNAKPTNLMTSPFAARAADNIFACGETEASFLKRLFPAAKISSIPFGSSIKDIDAPASIFEKEFNIKDFIFVVGRLEMRKNQLMLLYAMESSDIPIVFADGGFTYQPEYKELCRKFKRKGQVIFTGRLSDELLVSAYHACKIHCLTSWYELPGLVSIEAARYGCPIVASSWGGLPDYMKDACTWCSPDDPRKILKAVTNAFENGIRGSAVKTAGTFTWEMFGDQTIKHYHKVIQEHTNFAPDIVAVAEKDGAHYSIELFINRITQLIEGNKLTEALIFYECNRKYFKDATRELIQADALMKKLSAFIQQKL
jgi:glycosyltransferase involved in cell wall biosynthesis